MAITLNESSNYTYTITKDGTPNTAAIGNASATVNNTNLSLSVNFSLGNNYNANNDVPDSVIQSQRDAFLAAVYAKAASAGLTAFGTTTSTN